MPPLSWNLIWFAWLGLFLILEGLAIAGRVPWTTLSAYTWMLEAGDEPFRWVLLIGLAVLLTHLVAKWP